MDLYCSKCGEPWELAELHDVEGLSFKAAFREFKERGCEMFGVSCGDPNVELAEMAGLAYELLGDDADGAAAMLEATG